MNNSMQYKGNISMLLYVLMTALATILINLTNQKISPLLSAFFTFSYCMIIYNLFSGAVARKINIIKKHFLAIFMLNLTTAICWIFTFLSLKYIPPELYLFIYLGAMPIASAIIFQKQLLKAGLLLLGLVALTMTYKVNQLICGVILAFIGGASGTIYSIYSKKIVNDFSTLEILSLRFYLTVLITGFFCFYSHLFKIMEISFYFKFFGLSIIAIILPLILFQSGIKALPLIKALFYLPFAPLICYGMTFFMHSFNGWQLLSVVFLMIVMMLKEKKCEH